MDRSAATRSCQTSYSNYSNIETKTRAAGFLLRSMIRWRFAPSARQLAAIAAVFVLMGTAFVLWRMRLHRPERMTAGKFPEQLVYVRTQDDILDSGVIFTAPKDSAKPVAVILIHGWGVNFYEPTYVATGRALAERGYTSIAGNTRMHDLGNVEAWRGDKRVRGGGYWGVTSEEVRDLAAWIDFAEERGFKRVVLVGHSAGAAAVRIYAAGKQDPRSGSRVRRDWRSRPTGSGPACPSDAPGGPG
jgi:alpha-beta hydrolase superfamily lysophospholipase